MAYYPILVDLQGKKVIVVGGGTVAQRKIDTLLESGAIVHVVSRDLNARLRRYVEEGKMAYLGKAFRKDHLNGAIMAIAATNDPLLNRRVSKNAKEKGLLVNAVDQPSDCNFILPSILRRGDLLIAVSTSGRSPALAKKIREDLEKSFGCEYESLLKLMGRLRREILSRGLPEEENRRIFREIVDSEILKAIGKENWKEVASILSGILQTHVSSDDLMKQLLRAESG